MTILSNTHHQAKIIAITILLAISLVVLSGCSSDNSEIASRCLKASPEQLDFIDFAIHDVDSSNYILDGWAVKSTEFTNVYMVAAKIYGPGIEDGTDPAVWAVGGDPDDPITWLAVDGLAQNFTILPDASKTAAEITLFTDGVQEAKECYEVMK